MTPEILAADRDWPYSKAKTAVLLAAAAVIREDGPRSATLKNIANRAGITEPAIFRHFDGVDGLFAGLFHAYERVYQRFDEVYVSDEVGLPRFRTAILSIVDYLAAAKDFAYILIHARQVFRGYPDLRRRITDYMLNDQENALACITQGIAKGEIRGDVDPLSIANTVMGMVYMTVIMWIETGFTFDLREVCHHRWEDMERLMAHNPSLGKASRKLLRQHENALTRHAAKVLAHAAPGVGTKGHARASVKATGKKSVATVAKTVGKASE
jgi:TetR/AcrR family fatty acid metabolism transcriptional regulator